MKEFTIAVSGIVFPKSETYTIHAQNKKEAKKMALECFRNDFGNIFDAVKILAVWQHKDKEAQDVCIKAE